MRITMIGSLALGVSLLGACGEKDPCPNGFIEERHPTCGCENTDFADNPFCGECPDGFVDADDDDCGCAEFPDDEECLPVADTPETIAEARQLSPTLDAAAIWEETIFEANDRDMYMVDQSPGDFYFAWADRPGTEANGDPSGGTPDTVIRLYTADGTEIAVNDDMPFRLEETDAGMWWQATSADPIYVEVLEWADWRVQEGDAESPSGGEDYAYRVIVTQRDGAELVGDNDTIQECFASAEDGFVGERLSSQNTAMVYGNGHIESAGDVDVLEVGFEGFSNLPEDSELLCQFGFWPDMPSDLNPKLELYWEDCSPIGGDDDDPGDCDGTGDDIYLLGETNAPEFSPSGLFLSEDSGVIGVIPDGRFYPVVSSASGEGGIGHAYTVMYTCFNTTNFLKENEVGSVDPTTAALVPLNNPNDPAVYFGRFYGNFQPTGEFVDDFDSYAIVDGLGAGRQLTIEVESETAGATTGDLTMTLWRNDGGGEFTQLTSVTSPDPVITDHPLTAEDVALVVTLESDGTVQDLSTGYYAVVVANDP